MPLTLAEISHPNSDLLEFSWGPFKCRIIDVTFDNAYLTTGEIITAAQLGWSTIQFAFAEAAVNAAGTLAHNVVARPNAARTQVAVQAYETAATVDTPHKEVTSGADLSLYSTRLVLLGY